MTEFWTTLIKVHSSVEGNTALDENCTHIIGPYWIMEGETEFLTEEGVKFDEVAQGAVGALGNLSTEELIAICKQCYGVDLGESMGHPLEHRLNLDASCELGVAEEWRDLDPSDIKLDMLGSAPTINISEFEVKRYFEYNDPYFAHRIMVLPSYSVTWTPCNLTAVTFPCHDRQIT
jgi:hypothetical protein